MTLSLLSHSRISSPDSWKEYKTDETFPQDRKMILNKLTRMIGSKAGFCLTGMTFLTFMMATHPFDTCYTLSFDHIEHVGKYLIQNYVTSRLILLIGLGVTFVLGARIYFSVEKLSDWWKN
ncbi:MAG: hypothetical protein HQ488_02175 [Parcubacteria group bacterium]|nr:hypothetical protein [Parcubacteria group bacterium]